MVYRIYPDIIYIYNLYDCDEFISQSFDELWLIN